MEYCYRVVEQHADAMSHDRSSRVKTKSAHEKRLSAEIKKVIASPVLSKKIFFHECLHDEGSTVPCVETLVFSYKK